MYINMSINKIVSKILFLTIFCVNQYMLENTGSSINFCGSISDYQYTDYTCYNIRNSTNCNCLEQKCIRKCYQEDFFHYQDKNYTNICVKNNSSSVSVSGTKIVQLKAPFKFGITNCNNKQIQYFKLTTVLNVQENGAIFYKFNNYNNDCAQERNGLADYLCFLQKPDNEVFKEENYTTERTNEKPLSPKKGKKLEMPDKKNFENIKGKKIESQEIQTSQIFHFIETPNKEVFEIRTHSTEKPHMESFVKINHFIELTNKTILIENGHFTKTPENEASEREIHFAAKMLTVPFLLATFLAYLILPNPTIHSQALMYHVVTLMFGFICLGVLQFEDITGPFCPILGYLVIFFFSSAFLWMNVMCIDIWLAFSGLKGYSRNVNKESILYIYFNIYAWGLSILHVLIVFLFNTYMDQKSEFYPGIGLGTCFITEKTIPTFLYYIGPILLLILCNIILFILTVINICKQSKASALLNTQDSNRHADENNKIKLYWRLLFAMGLNPVVNTHLVQLVSFLSSIERGNNNIIIWYFKDFAHAMYGPVIFIIFVSNKKTRKGLKERYYKVCGSLKSADSTITMQTIISNSHTPDVQVTNATTDI